MASKSAQDALAKPEDIEEMLDVLDKTLDRLKVLYEQYFLGMQKQAPAYLHTDVERKLRDLTQINIRNTGLRYRFATISQKFGSYNSYWRRTLRQIENGTYIRNLSKIGREAARTGEEIPEEILAAMPKRMREQVIRDREKALAAIARKKRAANELVELEDADVDLTGLEDVFEGGEPPPDANADEDDDAPAFIGESTGIKRNLTKTRDGAHVVDSGDEDMDFEAFFASVEQEKEPVRPATPTTPPPAAQRAAAMPAPLRQSNPAIPVQRQSSPAIPVQPSPATPAQRQSSPAIPVQPSPATPAQRQSSPAMPAQRQSSPAIERPAPAVPATRQTGPVAVQPPPADAARQTQPIRGLPDHKSASDQMPLVPPPPGPVAAKPATTTALPKVPAPKTGAIPSIAKTTTAIPNIPKQTTSIPSIPKQTSAIPKAPSQQVRPNPIAPGAASARGAVDVEEMAGPFPREQRPETTSDPKPAHKPPAAPVQTPKAPPPQQRLPRTNPGPPIKPPPGMSDADVNALYANYVKAKQAVGEDVGPGGYSKLLKTINQQAPKIMEQYKAKGVDFSVVVKDNQVIIRAKPKG